MEGLLYKSVQLTRQKRYLDGGVGGLLDLERRLLVNVATMSVACVFSPIPPKHSRYTVCNYYTTISIKMQIISLLPRRSHTFSQLIGRKLAFDSHFTKSCDIL